MKTIYVSCPMPVTDNVMNELKTTVFDKCGIDINPIFFDFELDDQTCFFEIENEKEHDVINAINEISDFVCFFCVPAIKNDQWINMYD